jgi:conjugal transfer ATP-binding protein TraC
MFNPLKKQSARIFNFSHWSRRIAAWLGESSAFGVAQPAEFNAQLTELLTRYPLSSLLPYETYDPETGIFLNKNSQGFMLEVAPLTGATEQTVSILGSLLTDVLPITADLQCLLWASDKIGATLDAFAQERSSAGETFAWLAQKRAEFLKQGTLNSLTRSGSTILRDFRLFLVISLPLKDRSAETETLVRLREDFVSSLNSVNMACRSIPIENFISVISDLLNPTRSVYPAQQRWNELDSLALQVTDPEHCCRIYDDKLTFSRPSVASSSSENSASPDDKQPPVEQCEVHCFSVRDFPESTGLWCMQENIGQLFNAALQIPCPFVVSFHLRAEDAEKSATKAQMHFMNKESTARSPLAKFKPSITKEHQDWKFVRDRLAEGDRLVKICYQVILYTSPEQAHTAERKLRDLYRANGWKLRKETYLQMPCWLAMFPMMMTEGMFDDLKKLGRLRTMNALSAINLAPLLGEWKGTQKPTLLLPGRRGQIALWNPFDNPDGNYNIAVAATSGSGKSALTQEYIVALLGSGGRVWVIDVGRSYEKTCRLLGGEFLEFKSDAPISLNLFTFIDQMDDESLEILKPLLAAMARPQSSVTDEEMTFLEKAVKAAWDQKGQTASITTVAEWLSQQSSPICTTLSHLLYPYTKTGMYGKYFEGPCTLDIHNHFIVLELEELKQKKDLQKIVLLVLMYQISKRMYLGSRTQVKSCVIDEAWDLLGSDQEGAAKFIETGYRRARRYNANFVTITQGINDYFKNATSLAAFDNSAFHLILAQNREAIAQLRASKRFPMDDTTEKLFQSVRRGEDYSECVIKSPQGLSVHRIIFDPYSRILYSSKGEEFEAVKKYQAQGLSLQAAIEQVAQRQSSAKK